MEYINMIPAIVLICKRPSKSILKYYTTNFSDYKKYVVCPRSQVDEHSNIKNFIFISDEEILNYDFVSSYGIDRPGWVYQQLLKYEVVLRLDHENVFIIDGDTMVKPEILRSDHLHFTSKKIEQFYLNFISYLLPSAGIIKRNFIINYMKFSRSTLREMLHEIDPIDWKTKILKSLSQDRVISEYQMYALYVLNRPNPPKLRKIKVFRRMDLIDAKEYSLSFRHYGILAYEKLHKTNILKVTYAKILYALKLNYG